VRLSQLVEAGSLKWRKGDKLFLPTSGLGNRKNTAKAVYSYVAEDKGKHIRVSVTPSKEDLMGGYSGGPTFKSNYKLYYRPLDTEGQNALAELFGFQSKVYPAAKVHRKISDAQESANRTMGSLEIILAKQAGSERSWTLSGKVIESQEKLVLEFDVEDREAVGLVFDAFKGVPRTKIHGHAKHIVITFDVP